MPYEEATKLRSLTKIERDKAGFLKAWRTAIRLKYSLLADDEIYQTLPGLEERIDNALAMGQPLELNPGSVFFEDDDDEAKN